MALPSPTVAPVILNGSIPSGRQSYLFMPTVATLAAPTVSEMSAGTDYKRQIASIDGFAPEGSTVDFPNAGQRTIPNIPGTFSYGTGTVVFNLAPGTGTDARAVMVDGSDGSTAPTSGVWAFIYDGIVTSAKMRLFACTLISATVSTDITAPLTLTTMWAIQQTTGFVTVPSA